MEKNKALKIATIRIASILHLFISDRNFAKTQYQLALESGWEPRKIRKEIAELQKQGHPIVSICKGKKRGYYLATTEEEVKEYKKRLIAEIKAIAEKIKALNFILTDWRHRSLWEGLGTNKQIEILDTDEEIAYAVLAERQKEREWEAQQGI